MFKFMKAETAKTVLERGTLRWSTPRTFNDPYDVQFDLRIDIDRAEVRRLTLQKMWDDQFGPDPEPAGNLFGSILRALRGRMPPRTLDEFEADIGAALDESLARSLASLPQFQSDARENLRNSKILCLTIAPENFLMWTHYAGEHTGAVLGFQNVPELDSPWSEAQAVQYVDDLPLLTSNDELSDVLAGRAEFDAAAVIQRLVYSKSRRFDYEQEWRIYSGDGRNAQADFEDLGFHPRELASVTFGYRASAEDEAAIRAIVGQRYRDITFQRAELHPARYEVNIVPA